MGFLDSLLKRKGGGDELQALRERVEKNPKDWKLANDLSMQLKAKGEVEQAVHYALVAARAHKDNGFLQKALAVVRGAEAWGKPSADLLRTIADLHLELKHKEDARGALIKLRRFHSENGNMGELRSIDAQLAELGPGR
jgi:hypothetical protein